MAWLGSRVLIGTRINLVYDLYITNMKISRLLQQVMGKREQVLEIQCLRQSGPSLWKFRPYICLQVIVWSVPRYQGMGWVSVLKAPGSAGMCVYVRWNFTIYTLQLFLYSNCSSALVSGNCSLIYFLVLLSLLIENNSSIICQTIIRHL